MRNPTELMNAILTSPKAQEIIDYVSPVYGNSYVGLWIYQAIGTVLDEVYKIGDELRYETNPATATFLLDFWEDQYGLPRDPSLTTEQRRIRIMSSMQSGGPCNPERLATAISVAIGGIEVSIEENISKNRFLVSIHDYIEDLTPVVAVIERMKPAHLIYSIRIAMRTVSESELKTAIAMTRAEIYTVEVQQ